MASKQQKSNVSIVRDAYEWFNEGDIEAVLGVMDENIEWIEPEGDIYGGTYHGPDAVMENVFSAIMEDFEELIVDADRFIDGGNTVVVMGAFRGTARETGEAFDVPFVQVCELEDGKLTRFTSCTDTLVWRQALEA